MFKKPSAYFPSPGAYKLKDRSAWGTQIYYETINAACKDLIWLAYKPRNNESHVWILNIGTLMILKVVLVLSGKKKNEKLTDYHGKGYKEEISPVLPEAI